MNFRDPETLGSVVGHVLRYGVILSAVITTFGTVLLVADQGYSGVEAALAYNPSTVPHGNFDVSFSALVAGLEALQPFAYIELGVLILLATPVSRVLISVFLFAAEGDRMYMYITAVVLVVLLFSIFVTPLIPGFNV